MNDYDEFHDGSFDGLWVDKKTTHVFLTAYEKQQFTAVMSGTAALSASGFLAGSIILSVSTRQQQEIDRDDIAELFDLRDDAAGEAQADRELAKARDGNLVLLEIIPSYGASCLVLAHSVELLPRDEWVRQYCIESPKGVA